MTVFADGRGPTSLTILPTYRCTAACANCCFGSHPWVEGRIPQADILRYIREAAAVGTLQLVAFSGGECFLLGADLAEAIELATKLGLATRCVTNGSWAGKDIGTAIRHLTPFARAGLTEINFSTGDNHAVYVPIENIIRGAFAASVLGLTVAIMVELCKERRVTKDALVGHPLFSELLGSDHQVMIFESPWIPMDDEGPTVSYQSEALVNRSNLHARRGCDSILQNMVVTPQRVLKACCGLTSDQIPEWS